MKPKNQKNFSIEELKDVDPKAYAAYVEMLIANCEDLFTLDLEPGKITVYNPDNDYSGEWIPGSDEWKETSFDS